MRVLALTFGDATTASSHYRVFQYIPHLERMGIQIDAFPARTFTAWETAGAYDAILLQKKLLPPRRVRWLRRQAPRLVFDVDDAIWFPHGRQHHWITRWRDRRRLATTARAADLCIVPNQVLGGHLRSLRAKVELLPMALDGRQWPARSPGSEGDTTIRIGWAGNPVNLGYLEAVEPVLQALRQRHARVEFVVFCGARPGFKELPFEFVPYRPGAESGTIRSFDIGLLPLPDNDFASGKSPIKGLQYMASGVPCVASDTASVKEMFGDAGAGFLARSAEEWGVAITRLIEDPALRKSAGLRARARFESQYDIRQTAAALAGFLAAGTST